MRCVKRALCGQTKLQKRAHSAERIPHEQKIASEFIDLTPQLVSIANGHDTGEAVVAGAERAKQSPMQPHARPVACPPGTLAEATT
jgi:hypothetical protein